MSEYTTSLETIMTVKTKDVDTQSEWSTVWSTTNIPGMDRATGAGTAHRKTGRRHLRLAALSLGFVLTMHCRVIAPSFSTGYFVSMLLVIPTVWILANPLRHFEVYLGEWSLSGPGRAFRIIPMLDGIGMAICGHALIRAVLSGTMAAMTILYIAHSSSDRPLGATQCRTTELVPYEPEWKQVKMLRLKRNTLLENVRADKQNLKSFNVSTAVKSSNKELNTSSTVRNLIQFSEQRSSFFCKETFPDNYPPIYISPPYNFFYVEIVQYRPGYGSITFNLPLILAILVVWSFIWILLLIERWTHGRIIWNNIFPWFTAIPFVWAALVLFTGLKAFFSRKQALRNVMTIGGDKEVFGGVTDAFITGMYIHAAGLGSEIIHGKGLNFYASGHIDPHLNGENAWHSGLLLILTVLTIGGASVCALTDYMQMRGVSRAYESTLWVLPMYSKCLSTGEYAHLTSVLIFSGLAFSYITVAFVCLKTALHTIFEYKVRLVFVEQYIVAAAIIPSILLSLFFTSNTGLPFLEALDALMTGVAMPLICSLETFGLLYLYRSFDFLSDMNIATEENDCSSRIGIQWQILPFICMVVAVIRGVNIATTSEIPSNCMWAATAVLIVLIATLPARATYNALVFLRPRRRM